MPFLHRMEVTRPRVQRFPLPVRKPLRFKTPAMASSSQMRARLRTAATMSFDVAVHDPRRRRGKPQFGVHPALPMNHQDYFAGRRIDVRHHLVDQSPYDALFQTRVGMTAVPDGFEIGGQTLELFHSRRDFLCYFAGLFAETLFQMMNALQRLIPATLQFIGHQTILRIDGVKLLLVRRAS